MVRYNCLYIFFVPHLGRPMFFTLKVPCHTHFFGISHCAICNEHNQIIILFQDGDSKLVNNPTPHAFIMGILQTMEFASFTNIGLHTFGTHFASICNLSNFAATFFNMIHDLGLISLMVFIRITIWS